MQESTHEGEKKRKTEKRPKRVASRLVPALGMSEGKVTTYGDVYRSATYSIALFVSFIVFANVLHHLKCGYWCAMFFGSA